MLAWSEINKSQILLSIFYSSTGMTRMLIFFILLEHALALEIQNNNANQGLNFLQNGEINVFHHFEYMYITFDVSSVEYLLNNYQKIDLNCSNGDYLFKPDNITWNIPTVEPVIEENKIHRYMVRHTYNYLTILSINKLENENLLLAEECYLLDQISSNFTLINRELNKLADLDVSSIDKIVTFRQLAGFIGNMTGELEMSYLLPFSLQNMTDKVFNYVEFNFFQMDYKVTLSFRIPLYRTQNVFHVVKKPIIYNDNQFILHSIRDLAIFNGTKPVFFSTETLDKKCTKNRGYFCDNLKEHNECENNVLTDQPLHTDCLSKIDRINSIKRVKNDFYFIVFTPILISVQCESLTGTFQYIVRFNTHILIRGNTHCSLNTTDFLYDPHIAQTEFELHFPSEDLSFEESKIQDQTILIIEFIELLLLGCAGISVIALCVKIKRTMNEFRDIELESEAVSSINIYATIDE